MQQRVTPVPAEVDPRFDQPSSLAVCPAVPRPLNLAATLRYCVESAAGTGAASGPLSLIRVSGHDIGRVEFVEAAGPGLSIQTGGCAVAPRVTALIQVEGRTTLRHGERLAALAPGDLCLLRSGLPLEFQFDEPFRVLLVGAPEAEFADRFPLWRGALLAPMRADSGVPAVFRDAVLSMHRWQDSPVVGGSDGLANAVIDLMGALVCCAVPVNRDCINQSLYQKDRIKQVAQQNLRNPELDVDFIAAAVGLSARQVHRLFADEEVSLMRWVWVQRLEQCYRELGQDDSGRRSISDIAYTWGFNDQAHFSRTFRKQFGLAPREVRRQRGGESPAL